MGLIWLLLKQTRILEWCVVSCGSKSRHQNNMCLKEIGLHAQNLLAILGSVVNIGGEHRWHHLCDHAIKDRESSL